MASPSPLPPAEANRFLLLSEDDVRRVLTMEIALEAVEQGLRKMALDEVGLIPRQRAVTDHCMLHVMAATAKSLGVMGAKIYSVPRRTAPLFLIPLFDGRTGVLLALMQADYLGQVRTGAATGIATRYLARSDVTRVGIYGSGQQARTQLEAVCKVRPIRQAVVWSPNEDRRRAFAREMSERCGIEVTAADRPQQAAEGMDVIVTATSSREPVLLGAWVSPGCHVNAIGSNFLSKAEIDIEVIRKAADVVVDSKDQARLEAGDFVQAIEGGALRWADVRELGQVLVGRYTVRQRPEDVTLFKSVGIAIEDVALAARVYQAAVAAGVGRSIAW